MLQFYKCIKFYKMYQNLYLIVDDLAKRKVIEHIVKKYNNDSPYIEDLCQDLYLDLLSKDESLIVGLYERNEVEYFIRKMISNNIRSNTSSFYKNYQKYRKMTDELTNENEHL